MSREAMGGRGRSREREATAGRLREATGGHGRPQEREATAGEATGGHGNGRPRQGRLREATGGYIRHSIQFDNSVQFDDPIEPSSQQRQISCGRVRSEGLSHRDADSKIQSNR